MRAAQERLEQLQRQVDLLKYNRAQQLNRLVFSVWICCTFTLIGIFILTWLGIINLRIVAEIKIDSRINAVSDFIMFIINIFFWFSCALHIFDKRIAYVLLAYVPIYITSVKLINDKNSMIFNSLIPIAYITLISMLRFENTFIKTILRTGFWVISVCPYQQISKFIKMANPNFLYSDYNILTKFIYSIDLYLFYILIHWVVIKYVESPFRWSGFLKGYCQNVLSEIRNNREDVSDLTVRQRRVFSFLTLIYFAIQSFIVLGINIFTNKLFHFLGGFYLGAIELIIAWIALELCRLALGKTLHKPPLICNVISLCFFFLISRLGLPLHISLFFNIIVAALIAYLIHKLVIKNEPPKSVELTDREKQVQELKEIRGWKIEDIAAELDVNRRTITRILKSIKQKNSL